MLSPKIVISLADGTGFHVSYDLTIATREKPVQLHLQEFVASRSGLTLEGRLGEEFSNVIITVRDMPGSDAVVEVYSPVRATESEDLDEGLAALVTPPCWLTELGVPGFTKRGIEVAKELARHIADTCQGAVLDPQVGSVIWPESPPKLVQSPSKDERIREINLEWYLPPSKAAADTALAFLGTLRRYCPEAVPVRFGKFEPLQGRLEPGRDEPFFAAWSDTGRDPLGMLILKSKAPCFGGFIHLPGSRPLRAGDRPVTKISLQFDGRIVCTDESWREKVVSLFIELSGALGAFYGRGYVLRNIIASRGSSAFDGKSETYPSAAIRGSWCGIPPTPAWLLWFGGPYTPLVRDALEGVQGIESSEGTFVRLGIEPLDLDQLRTRGVNLPDRLMAKHEIRPTIKLPDGREAKILGAGVKPAEFIPELG